MSEIVTVIAGMVELEEEDDDELELDDELEELLDDGACGSGGSALSEYGGAGDDPCRVIRAGPISGNSVDTT